MSNGFEETFMNFRTSSTRAVVESSGEVYLNVNDMLQNMQMLRMELGVALTDMTSVPPDMALSIMDAVVKLLEASRTPEGLQ